MRTSFAFRSIAVFAAVGLALPGALVPCGTVAAEIILFNIDANEQAWLDALAAHGQIGAGGWNFDSDPDYGLQYFNGPVGSGGAGPVQAGTVFSDNVMFNVAVPKGSPELHLVALGPSLAFGNPHNAIFPTFSDETFVMELLGGITAVEFNAMDVKGGIVDIWANGELLIADASAPGAGNRYGILATNGDVLSNVELVGFHAGIQGAGLVYTIPAPGALALLGLAGVLSARRRR